LEVLYATPLHPHQWVRFLDLLCHHTGSRNSFLICANNQRNLSIQAQGGTALAPSLSEAWDAEYAPKDPYVLPALRTGKTGVVDCEELLTTEALMQTDMYRQIHRPAGYMHPGLIVLTRSLRRFEVISFWRTAEEGRMDQESNRLLELLTPHIQAALEIRQALGVGKQQLAGAQTMADASPTATFLLDRDGRIEHCNEAARAMLRTDSGLSESDGILRATEARSRKALWSLIRSAILEGCARYASSPPRSLSLDRGSELRPLHLLASPVPEERNAGPRAAVLLLATDPEQCIQVNDELLHANYGLTPAEVEVANGLLTGHSVEAIAALRRVSVGTVRQQLKAIFGKTGTSRQSELVRLLLSLPSASHTGVM